MLKKAKRATGRKPETLQAALLRFAASCDAACVVLREIIGERQPSKLRVRGAR